MRRFTVLASLVLALVLPFSTVPAQTPLAVDGFGSFGRGFGDGETISYNWGFRPVYDFGGPVNIGTELSDGPTTPTEWSFLLDVPVITIKWGADTSFLKINLKAATIVNEGTATQDNWVAATFNYKPNRVKTGFFSHFSGIVEPAARLINKKPDYLLVRAGLRYTFGGS